MVGAGISCKWPSRLRRKLAAAEGADARAQAEADERARWALELRKLLVQATLPIVAVAARSAYQEAVWQGAAGGLRARALRQRARDWQRAAGLFLATSGRPWPRDLASLLHFLHTLSDGGAPTSFDGTH